MWQLYLGPYCSFIIFYVATSFKSYVVTSSLSMWQPYLSLSGNFILVDTATLSTLSLSTQQLYLSLRDTLLSFFPALS